MTNSGVSETPRGPNQTHPSARSSLPAAVSGLFTLNNRVHTGVQLYNCQGPFPFPFTTCKGRRTTPQAQSHSEERKSSCHSPKIDNSGMDAALFSVYPRTRNEGSKCSTLLRPRDLLRGDHAGRTGKAHSSEMSRFLSLGCIG